MTPEKWQRVKALFEAALDQKEGERGIFLDQSCPDDVGVREEVLRLLSERDSPVLRLFGYSVLFTGSGSSLRLGSFGRCRLGL